MEQHKASWIGREKAFAAFAHGPLLDFWQQREEREFSASDGVTLRYVRFTAARHRRVLFIVPGRIESYVKYTEVAYDLFHCGFDIVILDHRGQGRSERLLQDSHRGHVDHFTDYVADLAALYQQETAGGRYQQHYALAHSMGGAILSLFLTQQPRAFAAVGLVAPMFGIQLPLPQFLANVILNWAEKRPAMRNNYAPGTGRWRVHPFGMNQLTHSAERYRRNVRFYADEPALRIGGPTCHWVRESLHAGRTILAQAEAIVPPILLLQAEEEEVVDNQAQDRFCEARVAAGGICERRVMSGARHEILFEKDRIRAEALTALVSFFAGHR